MLSVEPLVSLRGAGGGLYFTVLADPTPETYPRTDTSIWVLGVGRDPQQLIVRRLDDGAVMGQAARRLDPESFVGEREAFVYYTLTGEGAAQLHRCRTGITKGD
jgi:hypothetical protein